MSLFELKKEGLFKPKKEYCSRCGMEMLNGMCIPCYKLRHIPQYSKHYYNALWLRSKGKNVFNTDEYTHYMNAIIKEYDMEEESLTKERIAREEKENKKMKEMFEYEYGKK